MVPDHLPVLPVQGALDIRIDDSLLHGKILHIMVYQFRVILGSHPGKGFALRFRYAQPFKGFLDIIRNSVPVVCHFRIRADIGRDVLHIQAFYGRAPVLHGDRIIYLQ